MNDVTFVIRLALDYMDFRHEQLGLMQTRAWLKDRIHIFEELTLKSLLNQSFQDFRIFFLCGKNNMDVKKEHEWHPRVEMCYDMARSRYEEIDTDYVCITRIDSDDLFHKDAMAEIRDNLIFSNRRECLIYRKLLLWNIPAQFVLRPRTYYDPSPPFYAHVFPRSIYHDWERFSAEHYIGHGRAGGMLPETVELSEYKGCVVRHWNNLGRIKRGKSVVLKSRFSSGTEGVIEGNGKVYETLKDFGIEKYQASKKYRIGPILNCNYQNKSKEEQQCAAAR